MKNTIKLPHNLHVYCQAKLWCMTNLSEEAMWAWTISNHYVWHSDTDFSEIMEFTFLNEQDAVLFSLKFS